MRKLMIYSAGWNHQEPFPEAHLIADLRTLFRDPAATSLVDLDGRHPAVRDNVRAQRGYWPYVDNLFALAQTIATTSNGGTVTVVVACGGGRHRAPVVARDLADQARRVGWDYALTHLHIGRPITPAPAKAASR